MKIYYKLILSKISILILPVFIFLSFTGSSQNEANYSIELAYQFINSTLTNDSLTFNLEENTDLGIFTSDTMSILEDTLFNDEDRKYFRQQFAMLGKVKWEAEKITGATIISQAKVNQIFRRSFLKRIFRINNGWKKFKKKYGGCLTSISLPIFNVNQDYCIIYEWTQCHYLAGSGQLCVYHLEYGEWIFLKTYSYGMS
jgi:hypothetical protein